MPCAQRADRLLAIRRNPEVPIKPKMTQVPSTNIADMEGGKTQGDGGWRGLGLKGGIALRGGSCTALRQGLRVRAGLMPAVATLGPPFRGALKTPPWRGASRCTSAWERIKSTTADVSSAPAMGDHVLQAEAVWPYSTSNPHLHILHLAARVISQATNANIDPGPGKDKENTGCMRTWQLLQPPRLRPQFWGLSLTSCAPLMYNLRCSLCRPWPCREGLEGEDGGGLSGRSQAPHNLRACTQSHRRKQSR